MVNISDYLEYKEGLLFWKQSRGNQFTREGSEAGKVDSSGYKRLVFNGKRYLAHRVIFFLHNKYLPKYVDHINGDRLDNRIENLREVTAQQSAFNTITNRILPKNVYKKLNRYVVKLRLNGKLYYFGSFKDLELAEIVAEEARDKYHGMYSVDRRSQLNMQYLEKRFNKGQ